MSVKFKLGVLLICKLSILTMSADENLPTVNFEEINNARNDPNKLVIDVREPTELQEDGRIPGAINIPLGTVSKALGPETSNEDFKAKYLRDKPAFDFPILFTCRSGRRSGLAQKEALNLGYTNVSNYGGGWLDWENNIKKGPTYQVS